METDNTDTVLIKAHQWTERKRLNQKLIESIKLEKAERQKKTFFRQV